LKIPARSQSTEAWCEHWNVKINEDKTRGIYFSRNRRPPDSCLALNGRIIPLVNNAKYLGVIFERRVTWRLHIEMIEAEAFGTFIRVYSLFKCERLSADIKLTLHKYLIRSVMTYACPAWEFAADTHLMVRIRVTLQLTVGQSVTQSWCRAPFRAYDQIFVSV
jgi:hypothetical protein